MKTHRQQQVAGFTLAEVLTGMSVLSIALLAAFGLVNQTVRMIRPSRERTLSSQAAQIELDRLRASWPTFSAMGAATLVANSDNPALAALPAGAAVIRKEPYTLDFTNARLFSVAVEVSWQAQRGTRETNVLTSMIGEQGIVRR